MEWSAPSRDVQCTAHCLLAPADVVTADPDCPGPISLLLPEPSSGPAVYVCVGAAPWVRKGELTNEKCPLISSASASGPGRRGPSWRSIAEPGRWTARAHGDPVCTWRTAQHSAPGDAAEATPVPHEVRRTHPLPSKLSPWKGDPMCFKAETYLKFCSVQMSRNQ